MAIADALLPEFDREMTTTRTLLERVPEDKFAWKPHAKSMSLVELSTHVATIPGWGTPTLNQPELDFGTQPPNTPATSRADLLARFLLRGAVIDDDIAQPAFVIKRQLEFQAFENFRS